MEDHVSSVINEDAPKVRGRKKSSKNVSGTEAEVH